MAAPADTDDVPRTLGALLVGGSIALILSGVLTVQCIIYAKLYPKDSRTKRRMVFVVWILDVLHSTFIVISLFNYLIDHFGDRSRIDHIPWSIALTVVVTALQTLIAHFYYAYKICGSSGKNWWITGPIVALAIARLVAASISTAEMILKQRYSVFTLPYPGSVFTTGLGLSALVDLLITGWLCYFLQRMGRRTRSTLMSHLVHTMTLYTLENGLVTFVAAAASLICWLTMPDNLIFLGLHFVISKLYANSLLISLNTRKELREFGLAHESPKMWPIGSNGAEMVSPVSGGGYVSPTGYGTGTVYTYPYGVVSGGSGSMEVSMVNHSAGYHPAFKVPQPTSPPRSQPNDVGIHITRTVVRRASDDLSMSDVSRDDYSYAAQAGVSGRRNQFGAAKPARRRRSRERGSGRDDLRTALP